MMVSDEDARIRRFVHRQLSNTPDLSVLTLGILRRQYIAETSHKSLSPEARRLMKRAIEEELLKMQDGYNHIIEPESARPTTTAASKNNKRKRNEENEHTGEAGLDDQEELQAKKRCCQLSSDSNMSEDESQNREESEEHMINKSQNDVHRDSEDERKKANNCEEMGDKEANLEQENILGGKHKLKGKVEFIKREVKRRGKASQENMSSSQSDDDEGKENGQKDGNCDSSKDEGEKVQVEEEKRLEQNNYELAQDSDSSSLPSLEDQSDCGKGPVQETKKKTKVKREKNYSKGEIEDHKAVTRLKRYISLCGVRRNYKKLLEGCRSIKAKVTVLKKQLEDLGVHGQPSIEKCKKARLKREEAQEMAELDVSNIITSQGRPKRRGVSAWNEKNVNKRSPYKCMLVSGSDSDERSQAARGRRRATDWGSLKGIISDDADSS